MEAASPLEGVVLCTFTRNGEQHAASMSVGGKRKTRQTRCRDRVAHTSGRCYTCTHDVRPQPYPSLISEGRCAAGRGACARDCILLRSRKRRRCTRTGSCHASRMASGPLLVVAVVVAVVLCRPGTECCVHSSAAGALRVPAELQRSSRKLGTRRVCGGGSMVSFRTSHGS